MKILRKILRKLRQSPVQHYKRWKEKRNKCIAYYAEIILKVLTQK